MSRTTPWLFYNFFVVPNYEEFAAKPDSVRLAFNACISAFQQVDIFFAYYKRHDPARISAWRDKKEFLIKLREREGVYKQSQRFAPFQNVASK